MKTEIVMDMNTQFAANWMNLGIALTTLAAVIVAFIAIRANRKQTQVGWKQTQELALKDRQHQNRPIIVRNMGSGPAFNLHCVLYGPEDICQSQFVSRDDGPIEEKSSIDVDLIHSSELRLHHNNSVDGIHPLYDSS
jgi:hypothetical protein